MKIFTNCFSGGTQRPQFAGKRGHIELFEVTPEQHKSMKSRMNAPGSHNLMTAPNIMERLKFCSIGLPSFKTCKRVYREVNESLKKMSGGLRSGSAQPNDPVQSVSPIWGRSLHVRLKMNQKCSPKSLLGWPLLLCRVSSSASSSDSPRSSRYWSFPPSPAEFYYTPERSPMSSPSKLQEDG